MTQGEKDKLTKLGKDAVQLFLQAVKRGELEQSNLIMERINAFSKVADELGMDGPEYLMDIWGVKEGMKPE